MKKEEYSHLCDEVWEHNRRYYVDNQPTITDFQFDQLLKKLEEAEVEHPDWITPASPTQRIGESVTGGFKTVAHKTPMLSLANVYSEEELDDFFKRMVKLLETEEITFAAELKMDGTAVSVIYEKGVLTRGVTRGNGKQGDEVTTNVRTIRSLPLHLPKGAPDHLEVRGEVYIPLEAFQELNEEREEAGEAPWANPRNAAAGSLKLLDPAQSATRPLRIALYGIDGEAKSQEEAYALIKKLGLPLVQETAICKSREEIWKFIQHVKEIRPTLPFDIDGVVIKINDFRLQKRLGVTGKSPRWAAAYKFAPEQSTTEIRDITVQVGRTGVLTPVAELESVSLAGSTISRATLHNQDEVDRKDIRVGDTVVIEKGGDVIPKVVEVVKEKRPESSQKWMMPTHCPICDTKVVHKEGEVAVRCPNAECGGSHFRRIAFFASKHAMDIDHLGVKVVEQLISKGFVKRPADIYRLTEKELSQLEGFKERAISNLLKSIEKSKQTTLARFIMALGIPYVGAGTAELLANRAGTVDALLAMSEENLIAIEGVGEKVAESVLAFLPKHKQEIEDLLSVGVTPETLEVKSYKGHAFEGKTFVLTGTLQSYTRLAAASLIKQRGGKVTNSVSKKTDYLLAGESAGSKLDKAEKLGVKILDEATFVELL